MKSKGLFSRIQNIIESGNAKLVETVFAEHPELLEDINLKDSSGKTLLDYANSVEMKQVLKELGAQTSMNKVKVLKMQKLL